jgi:RHS repeat-associated protein
VWQVYGIDRELLAEYAASAAPSTPQKEYGYRNRELLVTAESAGQMNWIVSDHLGTPRIVADLSGTLANTKRHDYLPFGEELFAGTGGRTSGQGYAADNVRQHFTGYERDGETGLDYAQARYFNSTQGRFTSVDPLMSSANISDPQTFNRYAYVLNNPLSLTDPTGLSAQDPQKKNVPPIPPATEMETQLSLMVERSPLRSLYHPSRCHIRTIRRFMRIHGIQGLVAGSGAALSVLAE